MPQSGGRSRISQEMQNVWQKLYENENIWTKRGCAYLIPLLDPTLQRNTFVWFFKILGCGTGNYEDPNSCDCETCPIGTYNNQESAETCISCPPGWTTLQSGSTVSSQCLSKILIFYIPYLRTNDNSVLSSKK